MNPRERLRFIPSLSLLVVVLVVLVGGLACGTVEAQEPAPMADFGEIIDVRVVNLEVVVEKDGERLRGLGPEDFVLRVDGAEVPIGYFTEVADGRAVETASASGAAVPSLTPGQPVETSYLVYIDDFFTIRRDRNRVLDGLIEQVPNLQPGDRMAIVAFDGRSLDMVTSWTQSPREIEDALRKAKRRDAHGLRRVARRRALESGLPGSGRAHFATRLADEMQSVVLGASAALRSFADPPGRKVMLLLSGGWPANPDLWFDDDPTRVVPSVRRLHSERMLRDLAKTANRLSYTLYPVDVPGITGYEMDIADSTLAAAASRRQRSSRLEFQAEAALRALADETGGRAFINSGRFDALASTAADTRSYYWLGFIPTWRGDDTAHRVEVDVTIPGAKVRSRENYADLSRSTEVTMMVESTLRFGEAPGGVPLEVRVDRGQKQGWGKREVPLQVKIPVDELTFLPIESGYAANLELRVAVIDQTGDTADIPVFPMQMRIRQRPKAGDYSLYETKLKMRKERHDLVVSLYDRLSGKILSARVEVPKL